MNKILYVTVNDNGFIYLSKSDENEQNESDFVMVWEKAEVLFNDLKAYQNQGYQIVFN